MSHTKGPWKVKNTDNAIRRLTGAKTPNEIKANAQLISAAPDLLSACEIVQTNLKDLTGDIHLKAAFDAVTEAIAKAKGA